MHGCGAASSMTNVKAGQICILASGPLAGARVICVASLDKERVAISGPKELNKVALDSVKISELIPTSTFVDVPGKLSTKFGNEYFNARTEAWVKSQRHGKKSMMKFMRQRKAERGNLVPMEAVPDADQKEVDAALIAALGSDPDLKEYVSTPFKVNMKYGLPTLMNY